MARSEDLDPEAPEADAAEQATLAEPDDDEEGEDMPSLSLEAPEWDAQEQAMRVPFDDDYR